MKNQVSAKIFSDRFNSAMANQRMKGIDIADRLDVTPQTITGWRKGSYLPNREKWPEICEIMGLSLDDLFGPSLVNRVEEPQAHYLRTDRQMLRPLTGPPDDEPPRKIKREDLEAEVSYYLDRAERAGALQVAALHIRKYLRTDDFKYFDQDPEPPTKETP